jgi:predicted HNH restriction endonuclease
MANEHNLKPIRSLSSEEAKKRGSAGGKKSVISRREKKLMSQIYAEFLQKEHDVIGEDGKKKKLSGTALLNSVMSKVLSRGDSSSVSLMKEIREATEGANVKLTIENYEEQAEKLRAVIETRQNKD